MSATHPLFTATDVGVGIAPDGRTWLALNIAEISGTVVATFERREQLTPIIERLIELERRMHAAEKARAH